MVPVTSCVVCIYLGNIVFFRPLERMSTYDILWGEGGGGRLI